MRSLPWFWKTKECERCPASGCIALKSSLKKGEHRQEFAVSTHAKTAQATFLKAASNRSSLKEQTRDVRTNLINSHVGLD